MTLFDIFAIILNILLIAFCIFGVVYSVKRINRVPKDGKLASGYSKVGWGVAATVGSSGTVGFSYILYKTIKLLLK